MHEGVTSYCRRNKCGNESEVGLLATIKTNPRPEKKHKKQNTRAPSTDEEYSKFSYENPDDSLVPTLF
jgi:hypothetical protein